MDHDERQYFYAMEWREKLIDSSHFYLRSGHQNPPNFPMDAQLQIAQHVRIGEYELNQEIKTSFNNYVLITSDTRPDIPGVKLHLGFYYHSADIHEPRVGDVRLQFQLAGLEGTSYTVVGQLNESGIIEPFHSKLGQRLLIVKNGELSVEEVMAQEKFTLVVKSWLMRVLGTALLYMALSKLLDVLTSYRKYLLHLRYLKSSCTKRASSFSQVSKEPTRIWQSCVPFALPVCASLSHWPLRSC